jgi:uncharacterized membrane protein YhhN
MLETLFNRADGWDSARLIIVAASLAVSMGYLKLINGPPAPLRTVIKTTPVAILTVLPLTYLNTPGAETLALLTLVLALVLSACGDFFLALKDQARFFVPGLASFLLAHVAYTLAFWPHAGVPSMSALAAIVATAVAAGILIGLLTPALGHLRIPVYAYFAVIMVMVALALLAAKAPWYLGAGAVIFAISDSLIAIRKFQSPIPYNNEAVWITYIAAQFMLTLGLLVLLIPAQVP